MGKKKKKRQKKHIHTIALLIQLKMDSFLHLVLYNGIAVK